jgi:L-alanine-DL-glutamate epimerase-like enolase superfamily enzyme
MRMAVDRITVHTRRAFAIARGSSDSFERVIFSLVEGGETGRGEAAPTAYYGAASAKVAEALQHVEVKDPWDIEGTLARNADLHPSALAALDAALHDLAAKRLGVSVYRLLGLARPDFRSAYTLGIADPETTVGEAKRLSRFPILKMKVGGWDDLETVRSVSEFSEAALWVDANEAFSPEEAPSAVRKLKETGVAMVEQPVPVCAGSEALKSVTEAAYPVPVVADESAVNAADVPRLAGRVSGVNVKLAKCGGIRGALRMIHTARAHGMLVMLGCMVETSLGIAAAAQLGNLADFVDLDGAMLLADDPFEGPGYEDGRVVLLERPGLGAEPR